MCFSGEQVVPWGGNGATHLPHGLEELLLGQGCGNGPANIALDHL